jgi:hypothetical protein
VIAPDRGFPVSRLTTHGQKLEQGYWQGHQAASVMLGEPLFEAVG